jgi:hypothetical protein
LPPFPPQGTGYLTLLSRHSLQRGTIMLIPFLSLRWGMKYRDFPLHIPLDYPNRSHHERGHEDIGNSL